MSDHQSTEKLQTLSFEKSLEELQAIVTQMEEGKMPLNDSLDSFERGVNLVKHCQQTLETAEQKVKILTQKNNDENLEPYQHEK